MAVNIKTFCLYEMSKFSDVLLCEGSKADLSYRMLYLL